MPEEDVVEVLRQNMISQMCKFDRHQFVVFGASGDLAHKKIYPTLWLLFRDRFVPDATTFYGYARSNISDLELRRKITEFVPERERTNDSDFQRFLSHNKYIRGHYDDPADFEKLKQTLNECASRACDRIFYLALPPTAFESVCEFCGKMLRPKAPGCMRVIIEKPFGFDLTTSDTLDNHVRRFLHENEVYRIDHFLGKEMVQSLLILRFANRIFSSMWDRNSISNVMITFKEDIGTYGRGGYFDQYGIVRDVMQNHLLQIMCLVAMGQPATFSADDIRDAKTRVIREILEVKPENIVIGQYVKNEELVDKYPDAKYSYTDDPQVRSNSQTSTFACIVFYIKNERWDNVPFIVKCGKALNERKTEIRIQFRDSLANDLFSRSEVGERGLNRNELVIRVQPNEAIYMKINNKRPGREFFAEMSELDLTYCERYKQINLPEAYERLLMDVFSGVQTNFVRSDELHEAWKLFTPLLEITDQMKPIKYPFGIRSLPEADELCSRVGFTYTDSYVWDK